MNEMECDDGNVVNGDGCSESCEVEDKFDCSINSKGVSECRLD